MAQNDQKLHFVLFPFMAQGHMIPMVDIARLLARRGSIVTILTTPHNSNKFQTVISRAISSGLDIRIVNLKFPCVEAGLPEGYENFDMVTSMDETLKFHKATTLLQEPAEELIKGLKPNCLIADMCFTWTTDLALKMRIPRLVFHGTCCFSLLCMRIVRMSKEFQEITDEFEYFVVPGLPDRIEINKSQLKGTIVKWTPEWIKIRDQILASEANSFGTVANSFEELEADYVKEFGDLIRNKVYCVGPVSLCNEDQLDKVERGNKLSSSSTDEHLKWLESQKPGSVLYVCLGSLARLAASQLIELGLALEAANRPFVWVIRDASDELKKWLLEEKFEERVKNRGLLIKGWASQVVILSHSSVGGFLTHCGWNSTLEGVTAGVPMITWPIFAEQFWNEKFIVNVIKTGIRVGVEVPVTLGDEEKVGVLVKNDEIKIVIDKLMDGGEEGEERRQRAYKLKEKAKRAPEENGSSWSNLTLLIQDVIKQQIDQTENVE